MIPRHLVRAPGADAPPATSLLRAGCALLLSALAAASAAEGGAPDVSGAPPSTTVSDAVDLDAVVDVGGRVPTPRRFTLDEMATFGPLTTVHVDDGHGPADYSGIRMQTLLEACGVAFGEALHGGRLAEFVVATARDGSRVVYTLAEFDAALGDREAILAWRRNGEPLPAAEGPLRIVQTGDARPTRWVAGLRRLELRVAAE